MGKLQQRQTFQIDNKQVVKLDQALQSLNDNDRTLDQLERMLSNFAKRHNWSYPKMKYVLNTHVHIALGSGTIFDSREDLLKALRKNGNKHMISKKEAKQYKYIKKLLRVV